MIGRAGDVDHLPVFYLVEKGCATFGHNPFMSAIVQAKLTQDMQHTVRVDLPAHFRNCLDTTTVGRHIAPPQVGYQH